MTDLSSTLENLGPVTASAGQNRHGWEQDPQHAAVMLQQLHLLGFLSAASFSFPFPAVEDQVSGYTYSWKPCS